MYICTYRYRHHIPLPTQLSIVLSVCISYADYLPCTYCLCPLSFATLFPCISKTFFI